MNKLRTAEGFLENLEIPFQYRNTIFTVNIQPARVKDEDGKLCSYYPSANEELVEHALRKLCADQKQGFFDKPHNRSGVVFTLHMLREELRKRGHSRSYQQIILSLDILAKSHIEISGENGKVVFDETNYFPRMIRVTRKSLQADPDSRWYVEFHPLVTQSIDQLTYRQYNYHQMMSHSAQLSRWLHQQLALKYTFANAVKPFEMRFSTIQRDSALLNNYNRERDKVSACNAAFDELIAHKVLLRITRNEIKGARSKLEDVVYTLYPSMDFVSAMKAANKRDNEIPSETIVRLSNTPPDLS
jgi:hypothetical protein